MAANGIIGREYEQQTLQDICTQKEAKLVAVYGPIEGPTETVVRFDPNGGQFADVPSYIQNTYTVNDTITIPGNPQRQYFTFKGWAGDPNATEPDITLDDIATKTYAADNLEGLAWYGTDESTGRKINVLYAVWKEDEVKLNYRWVDPEGNVHDANNDNASLSYYTEDIKILTVNTARGSEVTTYNTTLYKFVGWYSDPQCTQLVSTDLEWKPTKAEDAIWINGTTWYAKFDYNLTNLTITKAGSSDTNQSFVFHLKGTDTATSDVDIEVVIHGNGTVTIKDIPVGSYTLTEDVNWSWRYAFTSMTLDGGAALSNGATITLNALAAPNTHQIIVTNARSNPYWLSGDNYAVNVNGSTVPTRGAGDPVNPTANQDNAGKALPQKKYEYSGKEELSDDDNKKLLQ